MTVWDQGAQMNDHTQQVADAQTIIEQFGLPKAQQNERSALSLLAVLGMTPASKWSDASNPLIGITPIMTWLADHYDKKYAPNTRETIRRQTMHQFCDAGLTLYNPDQPDRPVNSPRAVYQIEPSALVVIQAYGTEAWDELLGAYLANNATLVAQYAKEREQNLIPVQTSDGLSLTLTPGEIGRAHV